MGRVVFRCQKHPNTDLHPLQEVKKGRHAYAVSCPLCNIVDSGLITNKGRISLFGQLTYGHQPSKVPGHWIMAERKNSKGESEEIPYIT